MDRGGHWELVGVLKVSFLKSFDWQSCENQQGEGFDCWTNKTEGDGEWSNVAVQRQWIQRRLIPGAGKGQHWHASLSNQCCPIYHVLLLGEINLRSKSTNLLEENLQKGNVYMDDQPICDDDFGLEEAKVVCRWVISTKFALHKARQVCIWYNLFIPNAQPRMLGYDIAVPEQRST